MFKKIRFQPKNINRVQPFDVNTQWFDVYTKSFNLKIEIGFPPFDVNA
jgi:hypothetical protein